MERETGSIFIVIICLVSGNNPLPVIVAEYSIPVGDVVELPELRADAEKRLKFSVFVNSTPGRSLLKATILYTPERSSISPPSRPWISKRHNLEFPSAGKSTNVIPSGLASGASVQSNSTMALTGSPGYTRSFSVQEDTSNTIQPIRIRIGLVVEHIRLLFGVRVVFIV